MAREKPIPRSARKTLNRGFQRSRSDDTVKNISVESYLCGVVLIIFPLSPIVALSLFLSLVKVVILVHQVDKLVRHSVLPAGGTCFLGCCIRKMFRMNRKCLLEYVCIT